MANTNTPFGLQLVRGGSGYSFNAQGNLYSIPSTDGSAFYLNDAVKLAASGDANGVPNVAKAAGTDTLLGVIQGILPVPVNPVSLAGTALSLENTNIPATKAQIYYVIVNDDLTSEYVAQDDGITTANLVVASCNLNSSLTITAGASTTSPSATVLLSSSFAATPTLNIHLHGLAQRPGNSFAAYAKWNCRINTGIGLGQAPTGATGV